MKYVFAFDLDGTVTTKEILPIIAKELGIEKKMAILTKKTMDGLIPFDQSFTKRVDMLKNIPISKVQQIVSNVPLSNTIVNFIQNNRNQCYIVTQNLDVWIKPLINKIGVKFLSSSAFYKKDRLIGIKRILRKNEIYNYVSNPIVAIGEGHNDEEMLMKADISIAYGGVHHPAPSIFEITNYSIYSDEKLCRFLKLLL